MKEHPIIFSGDMVKAILEGRKTQTRRVIKPQPDKDTYEIVPSTLPHLGDLWDWHRKDGKIPLNPVACRCPYGLSGDRLWVRETWTPELSTFGNETGRIFYAEQDNNQLPTEHKWRPSIHMPRWASRITLEITNIRVERLQEISEEDAEAEGIKPVYVCDPVNPDGAGYTARADFFGLWDSLNHKYPWLDNPWVWVIEFRRIKPESED